LASFWQAAHAGQVFLLACPLELLGYFVALGHNLIALTAEFFSLIRQLDMPASEFVELFDKLLNSECLDLLRQP
jgi:hypothetical protein